MQSLSLWTYKYGEVEDYSVNIVNESNSNTKITKTTGKELGNKNSISSLQIYYNSKCFKC
jgi:hypothetical protein